MESLYEIHAYYPDTDRHKELAWHKTKHSIGYRWVEFSPENGIYLRSLKEIKYVFDIVYEHFKDMRNRGWRFHIVRWPWPFPEDKSVVGETVFEKD